MSFSNIKIDFGEMREPVEAGTHVARCYSLIDLGTQEVEWQGDTKHIRKLHITWELPEIMKVFNEEKGEQPQVIGKEYTLSFGDKANLYTDLTSWFAGNEPNGDMQAWLDEQIVGTPCMLNIIHKTSAKGRVYAKIATITPLPKSVKCPKQINPSFLFDLETRLDSEAFDKIPKFLQDKIALSPEYKILAKAKKQAGFGDKDDDVIEDLPF